MASKEKAKPIVTDPVRIPASEAAAASATSGRTHNKRGSLTGGLAGKFKLSLRSIVNNTTPKNKRKSRRQNADKEKPNLSLTELIVDDDDDGDVVEEEEEEEEGGDQMEDEAVISSAVEGKVTKDHLPEQAPPAVKQNASKEARERLKEIQAMIEQGKREMDQLQQTAAVQLQALARGHLLRLRQKRQKETKKVKKSASTNKREKTSSSQKQSRSPTRTTSTPPPTDTTPKTPNKSKRRRKKAQNGKDKEDSSTSKSDKKKAAAVMLLQALVRGYFTRRNLAVQQKDSTAAATEQPDYSWDRLVQTKSSSSTDKDKIKDTSNKTSSKEEKLQNSRSRNASSNSLKKDVSERQSSKRTAKSKKTKTTTKTVSKSKVSSATKKESSSGAKKEETAKKDSSNNKLPHPKSGGHNHRSKRDSQKNNNNKSSSTMKDKSMKDGSNDSSVLSAMKDKSMEDESLPLHELHQTPVKTLAALSEDSTVESCRRSQPAIVEADLSSPDEYEEDVLFEDEDNDVNDADDDQHSKQFSRTTSVSVFSQITDESFTSAEHDQWDVEDGHDAVLGEESDEADQEEDLLNLSVMATTKHAHAQLTGDDLKYFTGAQGMVVGRSNSARDDAAISDSKKKNRKQRERKQQKSGAGDEEQTGSVMAVATQPSDELSDSSEDSEDSRDSYAYGSRYKKARRKGRARSGKVDDDVSIMSMSVMAVAASDDVEVSDWEMESDPEYDDDSLSSEGSDDSDFDQSDDSDLSDSVMAVASPDHGFETDVESSEDDEEIGNPREDDMSITTCETDLPKDNGGRRRSRRRRASDYDEQGFAEADDEDVSALSLGTANKRQKKSQHHSSRRRHEKRNVKKAETKHDNPYLLVYEQHDSDEASKEERKRRKGRPRKGQGTQVEKRQRDDTPNDALMAEGEERLHEKLAIVKRRIEESKNEVQELGILKLQAWARGLLVRAIVDLNPETLAARKIQGMVRSALRISKLRKNLQSIRADHASQLKEINESKKEKMDDFKNFISKNDDMDTRVKMMDFLKREISKQQKTSENLVANIKALKESNVQLMTANSTNVCTVSRLEIELEEKQEKHDALMKVNQQWIDGINEYKERIRKAEKNTKSMATRREILKKHVDRIIDLLKDKCSNKKLVKEMKFLSEHTEVALGDEKVDVNDAIL